MSAREKILAQLKSVQRPGTSEPLVVPHLVYENPPEQFERTLSAIGGSIARIQESEIGSYISRAFPSAKNIMSTLDLGFANYSWHDSTSLGAIELVILKGQFGVAENGAVWITDAAIPDRSLPFICEHLCLVIAKESIVSNMSEAYDRIADSDHSFGTFIAGPSKTADIEQSLVLGAHGPKTLKVFLV